MDNKFVLSLFMILFVTLSFSLGYLLSDSIKPMEFSRSLEEKETLVNRANLHIQLQDYTIDNLRKDVYMRDLFMYKRRAYWDSKEKGYFKKPRTIRKKD
jgi:hypothetical protein